MNQIFVGLNKIDLSKLSCGIKKYSNCGPKLIEYPLFLKRMLMSQNLMTNKEPFIHKLWIATQYYAFNKGKTCPASISVNGHDFTSVSTLPIDFNLPQ